MEIGQKGRLVYKKVPNGRKESAREKGLQCGHGHCESGHLRSGTTSIETGGGLGLDRRRQNANPTMYGGHSMLRMAVKIGFADSCQPERGRGHERGGETFSVRGGISCVGKEKKERVSSQRQGEEIPRSEHEVSTKVKD